MEKSRIIKPIAFNTTKDADLLEWIKTVEKTEKLNYASYVRQLINQDMLRKKNGNVVIAGPTITTPTGFDYDKMAEQIQAAVSTIVNSSASPVNKSSEISSTLNSSINIDSTNINNVQEKVESNLDEDDMSNLEDIMNGNF
jgi:hypothetical protein